MKNLAAYFSEKGEDDIAEALSYAMSSEKRLLIKPEVMKSWLVRFGSVNDIVAVASAAFRYAERSDPALFELIATKLENMEVPFGRTSSISDKLHDVTILSAVSDGPHLKLIYSYAAALISSPSIKKVSLVFTGEWQWRTWCHADRNERIQEFYSHFYDQLREYHGGRLAHFLFKEKLEIHLAPRLEEYQHIFGDLVLRFEGPAPFKSTFLGGLSIRKNFPVVTATFSSFILRGRNSHATLIRQKLSTSKNLNHSTYFYDAPFAVEKIDRKNKCLSDGSLKYIVSAYSGDRIEKMFDMFSRNNLWIDIANFFASHSGIVWVFIGAANVGKAVEKIPAQYRSLLSKRIDVLGHSNLADFYKCGFAYLSVPKVMGGGRSAWLAIAHDVPVLTVKDSDSDVSNTLCEDYQFNSLSGMLSELSAWLNDKSLRKKALKKQKRTLKARKKIFKKGLEVKRLLDITFSEFNEDVTWS